MPLILDPSAYATEQLQELERSLRTELEELRPSVSNPKGTVHDPASLGTADDLLAAVLTLAAAGEPGNTSAAHSARLANLEYATLLAVVDLLKSHKDMPKVPVGRKPSGP